MKENNNNINMNKGNEHSESVQNNKRRIFCDMDGVTCELVTGSEWWLKKGVFLEMKPQMKVIKAIKRLIKNGEDVYILSAINKETPWAKEEKNAWLDIYLPMITPDKRIFTIVGESKTDYVPGGVRPTDTLIDDYNVNLEAFSKFGIAIKLLNGFNNSKSWNGVSVRANGTIKDIVNVLTNIQNALEEE